MQKWMKIAESRLGVKEIKGKEHNPLVVGYFADVEHDEVKNDETAWCAAFVGSCLENAGIASTKALNARSYLKWGRGIDVPVVGCIVVFWRENRNSWKAHVGFYKGEDEDYIYCLSGNQGNEVNVSKYPKSRLLGYRLPKTRLTSKTNWAAGFGSLGAIVSQSDNIGKAIDKVTAITKKGGDLADKIGGLTEAGAMPMLVILGLVGVFLFIMHERGKKVDEHGI
ncbi:MAG: hypothetical protein COB24_08765 [Hyphomicrobiales bacterium]|nr:MAG: hypothetical protein COB24_08765 [Hyphomicrobiales bacterium]